MSSVIKFHSALHVERMSMFRVMYTFAICGLLAVLSGCGGADGPKLVRATGVVNHNGAPLSGANVIFSPEQGPVATGTTDAQGRFELNTSGVPGAVLGPHTVAISAYDAASPGETSSDPETAGEVTVTAKSLIPEKYGNPISSGLTATVDSDASKNDFTFDLTD